MATINFSHVNPVELMRQTKETPPHDLENHGYKYQPDLIEDRLAFYRAIDARGFARHDAYLSSPVLGQKALVGYALAEVQKGRSTMETGRLADEVFTIHTTALADLAEQEGGTVVRTREEGTLRGSTHIALGNYVMTHEHVLRVYNGDDTDVRGAQGPFTVKQFDSSELALAALAGVESSRASADEAYRTLVEA